VGGGNHSEVKVLQTCIITSDVVLLGLDEGGEQLWRSRTSQTISLFCWAEGAASRLGPAPWAA
jgi:hypothetical protein